MTPGEETHRGFGFVDYVTKEDAKVTKNEEFCQKPFLRFYSFLKKHFDLFTLNYRKHLTHSVKVLIYTEDG